MLAMTLWWVLPLFAVNIMAHPFLLNLHSHLLYIVIIVFSVSAAITLSAVRAATNVWDDATNWGRYHLLCTAYTIQMIVTLLIVLVLDAFRLIGYYGGGPEVSVEMLFIPSALLYLVLGVFVRWSCKIGDWIRERQRMPVTSQGRKKEIAKIDDRYADRRRGDGGWIGAIFIIKLALIILGAWIVYQSSQAGMLKEDMTRYANEIVDAVKTTFSQR